MSNNFISIKNLPKSERPYEKFMQNGALSLTDAELLAVIIKTGSKNERATDIAIKILSRFCGDKGLKELNRLTVEELTSIPGIGKIKAIQLLCLGEISRRMNITDISEQTTYTSPDMIAQMYIEKMKYLPVEYCYVVMLNSKNRFIKEELVSKGSINKSLMPAREILVSALKSGAVNIILLHNHPSGDPTPSREDIKTTGYIQQACKYTGITLLDHIIIGDNSYISLRRQGELV